MPVHPHLRGEYAWLKYGEPATDGSPPPAWGILATRAIREAIPRFPPTCVGNTCIPCASVCDRAVHPHLRGEYDQAAHCIAVCAVHPHLRGEYFGESVNVRRAFGSPPPAWGIPRATRPHRAFYTVHPHLRGEYGVIWGISLSWVGSPPPAWGIPRYPKVRGAGERFTPTCVGNTRPLTT